jgi:hypothetical protein
VSCGDILADHRAGGEAGDPPPEHLPSDLDFIGADVASPPGRLGPRPPPLVADEGRATAVGAPGDGINGGTAGQQGTGAGQAAVVLQGTEQWIGARLIGRGGQLATPIAVQVVAVRDDRTGARDVTILPLWVGGYEAIGERQPAVPDEEATTYMGGIAADGAVGERHPTLTAPDAAPPAGTARESGIAADGAVNQGYGTRNVGRRVGEAATGPERGIAADGAVGERQPTTVAGGEAAALGRGIAADGAVGERQRAVVPNTTTVHTTCVILAKVAVPNGQLSNGHNDAAGNSEHAVRGHAWGGCSLHGGAGCACPLKG